MRVKAIVSALLVVMIAGSVWGQSSTVITLGGNYWRGSSEFNLVDDEKITKASNMIGPYLSMRFGSLTLGGSIFWGTWDLSDEFSDELGDAFDNVVIKDKREDVNFSVGYSLNKNLSIFGAYKSLKIENEIAFDIDYYYYSYYGYTYHFSDSYDETTEETFKFMGGGASMLFPFTNSPLFLYGSVSYLFAQDKDVKDLFGYTFGAGLFSQSGLTLMVGYRAETFKADDEVEGSEDWKIKGITATLAYTMR